MQKYYYSSDDQCGNYSGEGSCYNREHSFPKSWFGDASPMYTDLFHLYPTNGTVNAHAEIIPMEKRITPAGLRKTDQKKVHVHIPVTAEPYLSP